MIYGIFSVQRLDSSHAIVSVGSSKHVSVSGLSCCKQVGPLRARQKGLCSTGAVVGGACCAPGVFRLLTSEAQTDRAKHGITYVKHSTTALHKRYTSWPISLSDTMGYPESR